MATETPGSELPSKSSTDGELVHLLARGDHKAFWSYWADNRAYFFKLCMRWLGGNRFDAEDVLSRSALRVIDYFHNNPIQVRYFRSWIIRLLHNSCIDTLRVRSRSATVSNFDADSAIEPQDHRMDRLKLAQALELSVSKLPAHLHDVFVLRFIEELPYKEIARQSDISEPNARKRIQLARSILRRELAHFVR